MNQLMGPPFFETVNSVLDSFYRATSDKKSIDAALAAAVRELRANANCPVGEAAREGPAGDIARLAHGFANAASRAQFMRLQLNSCADILNGRLDEHLDLSVTATGCGPGSELLGFLAHLIDNDRTFPSVHARHIAPSAWHHLSHALVSDVAAIVPATVEPVSIDEVHCRSRVDVVVSGYASLAAATPAHVSALMAGVRRGTLLVVLEDGIAGVIGRTRDLARSRGFLALFETYGGMENTDLSSCLDGYISRLGQRPTLTGDTYFGVFEKR
ncbi:hypothetical protein FIV34_12200 [Luteibacter pinisoli]|uniref:Uncharacterized protein n=1 Tax=Luteibacter pinisoli TaxID=2589080 RepID=A0A4Y5Z5S4_9GAMM|nr:hypothetical protein [Luteibacter pinisoli]QDE39919.1 hypothetical protein FIV34_12200 [Luteibacter pinisoli]